MIKHDLLHRFILENQPLRGELVRLQESLQVILNQHPYPASIRRLLAEALCVAALLSAVIKFEGRLTVQFRGKGKLKLLMAQCNNQFQLRGLVKHEMNMPYEELMQSVNDGVLAIILDSGANHRRYQGVVPWLGNSLAESIEGYFKNSEQLLTRVWLAADEQSAAGFLLQVLPERTNGETDQSGLMASTTVTATELLNQDHESLIKRLFPEEDVRLFQPNDVTFKCTCSRQSGENAIAVIGQDEAEAELKDKQSIVVTCDFCNTEYLYDRVDVANIFKKQENLPPNTHLH